MITQQFARLKALRFAEFPPDLNTRTGRDTSKTGLVRLAQNCFFRLMCGKLFFPAQTQDINTGENPELRPQSEQVLGDVDSGDCFFNCVSDIHLTRRALLTSISRYRQYGIGMSFEF